MTLRRIVEGDALSYTVTVLDEDGVTPVDLSAATVAAAARMTLPTWATGRVDATSATITNAAAGEVTVTYGAGALAAGSWEMQLRVTLGGQPQTVSREPVQVVASAFA